MGIAGQPRLQRQQAGRNCSRLSSQTNLTSPSSTAIAAIRNIEGVALGARPKLFATLDRSAKNRQFHQGWPFAARSGHGLSEKGEAAINRGLRFHCLGDRAQTATFTKLIRVKAWERLLTSPGKSPNVRPRRDGFEPVQQSL